MTVALMVLWLHLLGAVVWMGGLVYQAHALTPAARGGGAGIAAEAMRRGRPMTWTAIALVTLTGFYNVTRLGPLERIMETGAALALAAKFMLVLAAVAVSGQRDFAQVPRLTRALAVGDDAARAALATIAWMDRVVLLLLLVVVYLGLVVSRS